MRILFAGGGTGGHLYPGLAIARAIVRLDPEAKPFFIGAQRGVERRVLPESGFPHALLDLHPLYRAKPWENWRTIVGLVSAWRTLGRVVHEERPAVVVGTGGYASGAALAYAALHGIPTALQEQNGYPGVVTRVASRVAREIYLGLGEVAPMLHPRKGAWIGETGNPIEPPPTPRPDRSAARERWGFPREGGKVLLIFGGSQGARALNDAVAEWVKRGLPENLFVIWGTGRGGHDRYAPLESARVRVRDYLSPIADAYAAADLALTRSGALTIAELSAWAIPPILVPLPTAAADHQTANARALMGTNAALMVPQSELSAERIDREIRALLDSPARLAALAEGTAKRARPQAAETIARRILALAGRPT